jgi:superfamily I DNA and/or RNA helicase
MTILSVVFVSIAKTERGLGFMGNRIGQKRVNVMLSRAKDELVVVGNLDHILTFNPAKVSLLL